MPLSEKQSYRWPTWVGLLLVTAYGLYVFEQYRRLEELNQRQLAMAAHQLKAVVENAVRTVGELTKRQEKGEGVCAFDSDQPYLTFTDPDNSKKCSDAQPEGEVKVLADKQLQIVATKAFFRVDLDVILSEMAFPEAFPLVFLAKTNGDVLYQEAPGSRRGTANLRWADLDFRAKNPASAGIITIRNAKALTEDKEIRATSNFSVDLGGTAHKAYLQPLTINGVELILGGVCDTRDLFRRALRVDSYFAALLTLLLLAGLAGIPFVKLWALNRRERFRLVDVHLLYLSTAALVALLTFAVVGAEGYSRYREAADAGLRDLAAQVSANFLREIDTSIKAVADLDATAVQLCKSKPQPCLLQPEADWFKPGRTPDPSMPPAKYLAHIEQIAWVGAQGKQVWKVTSDKVANLVDVAERPYIKMIRNRPANLYQIGNGNRFYFGPNRSITDGKFYTFVSTMSALGPRNIAVATLNLVSLGQQPLPANYGFALLNREGTVLYHSDTRLSLRENLLSDVGNKAEFQAFLLAETSGQVTTSYRERPHNFFITPIDGLRRAEGREPSGLVLVTFRDTTAEVATMAHVFLQCLGPFLFLLAFMAAGLWVTGRVSRGMPVTGSCPRADRLGTWLWPQAMLEGTYKTFSKILAILLLILLLAGALGYWGLWLIAPPVVLIAGTWVHWRGRQSATPGPRHRQSTQVWNLAQWVLTTICLVILPAASLIHVEMAHEFGKMVVTENLWVAQQRKDLTAAARASASDDGYSETMQAHIAKLEQSYQLTAPSPFDKIPTQHAQQSALSRLVIFLINSTSGWMPMPNDTIARYRQQPFHVNYDPPHSFGLGWPSAMVWPALFVLLFYLFKWIRWNARNLFLSDVEIVSLPQPVASAKHWLHLRLGIRTTDIKAEENSVVSWEGLTTDDERFLMLQIAEDNLANPRSRRDVERLLARGYLVLNPDLQPAPELCQRACEELARPDVYAALRAWEAVDATDSWHYVRTVAFGGLTLLALILFQSELTALAGVAAAALTQLARLQEVFSRFLPSKAAKGGEG